jgi:glycosyltransferase involved in cell wall biosynthesis
MKILVVYNSYQRPNGEDVVFSQERQILEGGGHEVVTFCRSNFEISSYSALKQVVLLKRAVWATDTKQEIASVLQQEKPDIVHVHNTFMMISPSIYSACREAGVPAVQTLHNYRLLCPASTFLKHGKICEECVEHSLWRSVAYGCYRDSRAATATAALTVGVHRQIGTWNKLVDGYIALTEFGRQKFIVGGLPAEKIAVKPNFVHPDPGTRQGPGEGALFVGRLSEEKGVGTLLSAWRRLRGSIPLDIVGDGPLRPALEAETQRDMLKSVQFRGWMPRDQSLATMKLARFLIFPSEWYEGFGMTIIEAFACGVPVICSRLGAAEELVADGRTGLHFTPGDAEDLAQKVEWAWAHPEEMEEMGRAARAEFELKYSADRNYQMLLDIYRRVIAAYKKGA